MRLTYGLPWELQEVRDELQIDRKESNTVRMPFQKKGVHERRKSLHRREKESQLRDTLPI